MTHARALLGALLVVSIGLVGLAAPASAHQGDITATVACVDGDYEVTYTLSWNSVPEAAYGTELRTRTGGPDFDDGWTGDPGAYAWDGRGTIDSAAGSVRWTETLPGDTVGAGPWVYAWTPWANQHDGSLFHDTRIENLGGDCAAEPEPEPVTVQPSFTDNVCVGGDYTEPSFDAPEVAGTDLEVVGQPVPGETLTVTYTALEGHVIDGRSVFEHTFPTTPASVQDCQSAPEPEPEPEQPEPVVQQRSERRDDCRTVERRTWEVVTGFVREGGEWVPGEPEIRNDSGWRTVRRLTVAERVERGCIEVEGEETPESPGTPGTPVTPGTPGTPSAPEAPGVPAAAPTSSAPTVPTAVDAGLAPVSAPVVPTGPGLPGWLAALLGGVLLLGAAGFERLRRVAS